jgi:STAS domain-containing protein
VGGGGLYLLSGPTPGLVELNLADLDFVDSAGIRCLLNCRSAVETAGSRLVLVEPSPQVVRVLDITGLFDVFGLGQRTGTQRSHSPHGGMRRGQPLSDLLEESAMPRRTAQQVAYHEGDYAEAQTVLRDSAALVLPRHRAHALPRGSGAVRRGAAGVR